MPRRIRTWYRKFVRFNLWATLYGSWAVGLFPFVYISKERKLQRSKWLVGYGILFNVAIMWVTYINYSETDSTEMKEMFHHNPLAAQINVLHNVLLLLMVFVMYARNWWLSEDLGKIINILLNLYENHLKKYDSDDCFKFNNFVIYKGTSIVLEISSMLAITFGMTPRYNLQLFLGIASFLVIQFGVLIVGMHFNLAVLYIYRFIWIINRELLRIVNHLRVNINSKSPSVDKLYALYSRLLMLNKQLVGIYDYQMTLFMMSLLTVNITSVFYMIIYSISMKRTLTFGIILNSLQVLVINVMDFWLNIAVCELGESSSRGTSSILKLFSDIPGMNTSMQRSLNDFALFCSHERIKFNHCGLFTIQNAMGFRMIITSGLYLLYLVQFDFMNL